MNKNFEDDQYSDMINMPHYVSKKRNQMSIIDRAAQFAPFAALTGYDDAVKQAGRVLFEKVELSEETTNQLNKKLQMISELIQQHNKISVTFFKRDGFRNGGEYITITDRVKNIDEHKRRLIFFSGKEIFIDEIYKIEGEMFGDFF